MYVTTVADDNPISQTEHQAFLDLSKNSNICIPSSHNITDRQSLFVEDVQTDGIVVFTDDISNVKYLKDSGNMSKPFVIVRHDRKTEHFQYLNTALVLSDAYDSDSVFSDYMINTFWKDSTGPLVAVYYQEKFNCSLDQTNVVLTCPNVEDVRAHFLERTSSRDMRIFDGVLNLLSEVSETMSNDNCLNYDRSCVTNDMLVAADMFEGMEDHTLVPRSPYRITVTMVEYGNIVKVS